MKSFYVYIFKREDGSAYYIGKGHGDRAFVNRGRRVCKRPVDPSRIQILTSPNEDSAFETEKFLIAYYGRKDLGTGCLYNLTDGGDGPSNPTPEIRVKQSAANKRPKPYVTQRNKTPEQIAAVKAALTGKPKSELHKANLRAAARIANSNPELRARWSKTRTGMRQSPETIAKRVAKNKARWAIFGKKPKRCAYSLQLTVVGAI